MKSFPKATPTHTQQFTAHSPKLVGSESLRVGGRQGELGGESRTGLFPRMQQGRISYSYQPHLYRCCFPRLETMSTALSVAQHSTPEGVAAVVTAATGYGTQLGSCLQGQLPGCRPC